MIFTSFDDFVNNRQRVLELNASTYKHAAEIRAADRPESASSLLNHLNANKEPSHMTYKGLSYGRFFIDDRLSVSDLAPEEFQSRSLIAAMFAPVGTRHISGHPERKAGHATKKSIIGTISRWQDSMKYVWALNGTLVHKYLFMTDTLDGNIADGNSIELDKVKFLDRETADKFHNHMTALSTKPEFQPYDFESSGVDFFQPERSSYDDPNSFNYHWKRA